MEKEICISFCKYPDANWGKRKLGKGRIAFDFWKFSIHFAYYDYK